MKKITWLLILALFLLSLGGCAADPVRSSSFFLMDTAVTVTLYTTDGDLAEEIFSECRAKLTELDNLWSRTVTESDVASFNASADGAVMLDSRTLSLVETAMQVSALTDGAFDITVAPLVDMWKACEKEDRLPNDGELSAALAVTGYQKLTVLQTSLVKNAEGVQIDLGGIGKGAAIGVLIDYLNTCEVSGGLVSFGSNVAVFGKKPNGEPYRVALRDPKDENASVGTLTLEAGEILSVSGDYERYVTIGGERYHHILDPSTGYPAETGLASVAVITKDGALADALSTALFVMGQERAMAFYESGVYDFEAIFISHNGTISVTAGLEGRFAEK